MKPTKLKNERWIVTRTENFVNWCAWREWLHRETGRGIALERMCVWGEWPPETAYLAQTVVQKIAATRADIEWHDSAVCDPAQSWDRWGFAEREEMERKHREDFMWNPPLIPFRGEHNRRGPEKVIPFNPGPQP